MTDDDVLHLVQEVYNTITSPYMPNTDVKASELKYLCYLMSKTGNSNIRDLILCYIGSLLCTDSDIYHLFKMGYSENSISVRNFKFSRSIYPILHHKIGVGSNIIKYDIFISTSDLKKSWNVTVIKILNNLLFITPKRNILLIKRELFNNVSRLYKRIW